MGQPFHVPFITTEGNDDLIVSFPLDEHAQISLTLMRTLKFEALLDNDERGVSLVEGNSEGDGRELLVSVKWNGDVVEIVSNNSQFTLDVSAVDPTEVAEAKAVLREMNFDRRFKFSDA